MTMKHEVTISVAQSDGVKHPVIESNSQTIRSKLLDRLFGKHINLFVFTPGASVKSVEIKEVQEGGENDGQEIPDHGAGRQSEDAC